MVEAKMLEPGYGFWEGEQRRAMGCGSSPAAVIPDFFDVMPPPWPTLNASIKTA
jgi:hypothetical protein